MAKITLMSGIASISGRVGNCSCLELFQTSSFAAKPSNKAACCSNIAQRAQTKKEKSLSGDFLFFCCSSHANNIIYARGRVRKRVNER